MIIARCLHLSLIFGSGLSDGVVKISPLPTTVATATNFETKIAYNSAPVKNNCVVFYVHLYFRARATGWCHLNFSPADSCCYLSEFWDKIDYNNLGPRER